MSAPRAATPPELDAVLRARADGAPLQAVWNALPDRSTDDEAGVPAASRRDAAWAALSARLADPTRLPFTDDVAPPIALLSDNVETAPAAAPPISRPLVARPRRAPVWQRAALPALVGIAATIGVMVWRAVPRVIDGLPGAAPTAVTLADGSAVWLAAGARLSVPRALGWPSPLRARTRDVTLRGTGFFTVARDGRAFTVQTGDLTVRVLGTRFEVRARANGSQVLVEEGRVAVRAERSGVQVELGAGDVSRLDAGRLTTTRVAPARVGAWRRGGLAALDEPLRDVVAELGRRYATDITLDDNVPANVLVSLFYPQAPSIEVVLTDLCTAQGLRYRQTSRGFVIAQGTSPE